jgi:peptidoglycan/LPS O-acetylase OafA/YrhL
VEEFELPVRAVIVSHTWPLHDHTYPLGDLGAAAVYTFFAISGYLVFASWERDPHVLRFLLKRVLRIFPALLVVTIIGALVIGPMATTLPVREYFANPLVARYLGTVLLYPTSFSLPGVFADNPFPNDVNSSIWTLAMEFAMYLGVAMLGACGLLTRRTVIPTLVTALACFAGVICRNVQSTVMTMDTNELVRSGFCFASGMLLRVLHDRKILTSWAWLPITTFLVISHQTAVQSWALLIFVPYGAIAFASRPLPYVHKAGRFGDPSYGVYIYAFMVQQSLMHWIPTISVGTFLVSASVISIIAGYASWHLVEKRALRLKRRPILGSPKPVSLKQS